MFLSQLNNKVANIKNSKIKNNLNESNSLHVFDIDETLFNTNAKIHIKNKNSETVKTLNNQQFNDYVLQQGESYDFHEFRDPHKFRNESTPINSMIKKITAIHNNIKGSASKIIMNTARSDFTDKEPVLQKFRDHGIDIDDMHLHRAGNIPGNHKPAEKKNVILTKYLDSGKYTTVHFYDDSETNLKAFYQLEKKYPNIKFNAYLVKHGKLEKYK
jgi:hypothetical protein